MARFTYGGETYTLLSEDDLTFAEGAAACKAAGVKPRELDDESFEVLQALIWVTMKRGKPELKFADLNDAKIGDFEFLDDEDEPDPTTPDAETSESSG